LFLRHGRTGNPCLPGSGNAASVRPLDRYTTQRRPLLRVGERHERVVHVLDDLEVVHAHADEVGAVLEGEAEAVGGGMAPAASTL